MSKLDPRITEVAIIFLVQDLSRTRAFYREALGLRLEEQEGYLLLKMPNGTEILFFRGRSGALRVASDRIRPGTRWDRHRRRGLGGAWSAACYPRF